MNLYISYKSQAPNNHTNMSNESASATILDLIFSVFGVISIFTLGYLIGKSETQIAYNRHISIINHEHRQKPHHTTGTIVGALTPA